MEIVYLPKNINQKSVEGFFKSLSRAASKKPKQIALDFSPLEFCDPFGVTSVAGMIDGFARAGIEIFFTGLDCESDGVKYLKSAGFFNQLSHIEDEEGGNSSIPFLAIYQNNHIPFIHTTLKPWIDQEVNLHEDTLETICACLTEALQNVEHHGGGLGFTLSQYYPDKKEIQFAVSDTGMGIPYHISKSHAAKSEKEALELAIKRGVTSKTNYTNRGFGLDNLIKYTVGKNSGSVTVRSANAKLIAKRGRNGEVQISATNEPNFMPGTTVQVVLKTGTLEESGELKTEVFQWF